MIKSLVLDMLGVQVEESSRQLEPSVQVKVPY